MSERHQFRASWHDYSEGIYFITICCADHRHFFGHISSGKMFKTRIGDIAESCLKNIPSHFPEVEVWNHVVMPNHIHMIIAVGTRHGASTSEMPQGASTLNSTTGLPPRKLGCLKPKMHFAPETQDFHHNSRLSVIIGQFKSSVSRLAKREDCEFKWQSLFHEHIIRNQQAYDMIMNYIDSNVENWSHDRFNAVGMQSVGTRHGASTPNTFIGSPQPISRAASLKPNVNVDAPSLKPNVNVDAPWRVPTEFDHEA